MLRFLRVAALLGMVLALLDFFWTAFEAPQQYELAHDNDFHDFQVHLHHVLHDQYQSSLWFAAFAILYVLTIRTTSNGKVLGPSSRKEGKAEHGLKSESVSRSDLGKEKEKKIKGF
jgi:hypothetical protein